MSLKRKYVCSYWGGDGWYGMIVEAGSVKEASHIMCDYPLGRVDGILKFSFKLPSFLSGPLNFLLSWGR